MLKNKIRDYRKKLGVTKKEFALIIDVPVEQLIKWEKQEEQPDLEAAWNLSRKIDCNFDELFEVIDS